MAVVKVIFEGDDRGAVRTTRALSREITGLGRTSSRTVPFLRTLGTAAAVGVGAAFAGLAATLKIGFDELSEGQKVMAQTGAVLESTGGVANVTAKEVEALAGSLSRLTGIDDEAIQAGENLLLTFKNVRNEVGEGANIFDRATASAIDLSVAGFGSLDSTAKQLGKALNDPIKGMTALGRSGVTFSEDQKKAIEAMVKANDLLGAQKLILAEVESQVAGSGKAYGETLPGQLSKLKNAFQEAAAEIAATLLPHLMSLLDWVNAHMPEIQTVIQTVVSGIEKAFEGVGTAVGIAMGHFDSFKSFLEENPEKAKIMAGAVIGIAGALGIATAAQLAFNLAVLLNPYVAVIVALGALTGALVALYLTNQRVHDAVNDFYADLRTVTLTTLEIARAAWDRFGTAIMAIGKAVFLTVTLAWRNMLDIVMGVFDVFAGLLTGDWSRLWNGLKRIFDGIIGNLLGVIKAVVTAIFQTAVAIGKALLEGIRAGAESGWAALLAWLTGLRGRVMGAFADAGSWLVSAGRDVIAGLWSGMASIWSSLVNWAVGAAGGLVSAIKDKLMFWKSPPEAFGQEITERLVGGMIAGFQAQAENMKGAAGDAVKRMIEAAEAAIADKRGAFASAFSALASEALAAFDKMASDLETKTEKQLRLMDEREARADRKRAIAEAKAALTAAVGEGLGATQGADESAEDFARRQAEIGERIKAAQRELDEALAAQHRWELEQRAARERANLDDRLALKRRNFEQDLEALQNYANKHALSAAKLNERLLEIFEKYDVPFRDRGEKLGLALADALRDARKNVGDAAQELADTIRNRLGNISVTVKVHVSSSGKPGEFPGIGTGNRQHGGPVRRGAPYIVGEAGPEIFIPQSSGQILPNSALRAAGSGGLAMAGGGGVRDVHVHLHADGYFVGSKRELIDSLASELKPAFDRVVSYRNPI